MIVGVVGTIFKFSTKKRFWKEVCRISHIKKSDVPIVFFLLKVKMALDLTVSYIIEIFHDDLFGCKASWSVNENNFP